MSRYNVKKLKNKQQTFMQTEPSQTIAALLIENLFTRYNPKTHAVNGHWTCLCNSYIFFFAILCFLLDAEHGTLNVENVKLIIS